MQHNLGADEPVQHNLGTNDLVQFSSLAPHAVCCVSLLIRHTLQHLICILPASRHRRYFLNHLVGTSMCKRDLDMQTCSRPLINELCARSVHTFLMWGLLLGGMHAPG